MTYTERYQRLLETLIKLYDESCEQMLPAEIVDEMLSAVVTRHAVEQLPESTRCDDLRDMRERFQAERKILAEHVALHRAAHIAHSMATSIISILDDGIALDCR